MDGMSTPCEHCDLRASGAPEHLRVEKFLLEMLSGSPKSTPELIRDHTGGCHDCLLALTESLALMGVIQLTALRGGPEQAVTFLKSNIIGDENGLGDEDGLL
ncbi:hypothetical protein BOH72_23390 [Mycobacterium sp. WY10]|nr:hypothetical protein BOH72_23390 [Mycobacterium sp. WY10]